MKPEKERKKEREKDSKRKREEKKEKLNKSPSSLFSVLVATLAETRRFARIPRVQTSIAALQTRG